MLHRQLSLQIAERGTHCRMVVESSKSFVRLRHQTQKYWQSQGPRSEVFFSSFCCFNTFHVFFSRFKWGNPWTSSTNFNHENSLASQTTNDMLKFLEFVFNQLRIRPKGRFSRVWYWCLENLAHKHIMIWYLCTSIHIVYSTDMSIQHLITPWQGLNFLNLKSDIIYFTLQKASGSHLESFAAWNALLHWARPFREVQVPQRLVVGSTARKQVTSMQNIWFLGNRNRFWFLSFTNSHSILPIQSIESCFWPKNLSFFWEFMVAMMPT